MVDSQYIKQAFRFLPLLWISLSFLVGIAGASFIESSVWVWLAVAAVGITLLVFIRKRSSQKNRLFLIMLVVFSLGAARYQSSVPEFSASDLAFYNDHPEVVSVHGILNKPPVLRGYYIEVEITADWLQLGARSFAAKGNLIARLDLGQNWRYGDEIVLRGRLETPDGTGDFSYREYLARKEIYSEMSFPTAEKLSRGQGNGFWSALYAIKERAVAVVYKIFSDPEAGLFAGILLGDESGLSESLKSDFNTTGTRHIIAISGFNISIIAGLMLALFTRWLGEQRGIWLAILGVGAYTILVGAEASVVRAAIMGVVALVARQVGRQQFALNTLGFSAALMALFNPLILWDVGFQLSFAATIGLVVYTDPIKEATVGWLSKRVSKPWIDRLDRPLTDYVFLTFAAQITTFPLLLYYFHRFTLLSLPANLLILPAQPALMILGGASVIGGLIFLPLGNLLSFFAWPFAAFTIRVVQAFAQFQWASQGVSSFPVLMVFLYYAVLVAVTLFPLKALIHLPRLRPVALLAGLAALSLWAWNSAFASPDGRLQITLLDVPGESVLIRTPLGRNLLINGGSDGLELREQLGRSLPLLGRYLDWVIVAGQRPEQISGFINNVDRISDGQLAWAGKTVGMSSATLWAEVENEEGLKIIHAGDVFDLGEGASLRVVGVSDRGAMLLIEYGNYRALFPMGLDFALMEDFKYGQSIGKVSVLLLADSGYPPLNPQEWIANLDPEVSLLSGSAEPDLLAVLAGRTLMSTNEYGWITISTDGFQMWLEVENNLGN